MSSDGYTVVLTRWYLIRITHSLKTHIVSSLWVEHAHELVENRYNGPQWPEAMVIHYRKCWICCDKGPVVPHTQYKDNFIQRIWLLVMLVKVHILFFILSFTLKDMQNTLNCVVKISKTKLLFFPSGQTEGFGCGLFILRFQSSSICGFWNIYVIFIFLFSLVTECSLGWRLLLFENTWMPIFVCTICMYFLCYYTHFFSPMPLVVDASGHTLMPFTAWLMVSSRALFSGFW